MTMFEPTLIVSRLVVFQNSHTALDISFHKGVNVVRGRNSSGKTTVMDLLAFSLGAESIRWKPEALRCTETIVEVELNGATACLRREISSEAQQPMAIHWGSLSAAISLSKEKWERYPFRRSPLKSSFSQVLLDALKMPQAQGDGASNLTLHQILRVLYADQPSVHSPIFRLDRWDSALTREMIGAYLSGAYDDDLYSAQLRTRVINSELTKKIGELKGIFHILGKAGHTPDLSLTNYRLSELERKRDDFSAQLVQLKSGNNLASERNHENEAIRARRSLSKARSELAKSLDRLEEIRLEMSDSELFVTELRARLSNLDQSQITRSELGSIEFPFCPCCLEAVEALSPADAHCSLCKSALSNGINESQILRMRNELILQLAESESLMSKRSSESKEVKGTIPLLREQVKRSSLEYSNVIGTSATGTEEAIEEVARSLGSLDEEIQQAHRLKALSDAIEVLQKERDQLQNELTALEVKIETLQKRQESRLDQVANSVESSMLRLLPMDLPLQLEFTSAKAVVVDYVENSVYVNGSRNFSESSAVVLRHIFHLALLSASAQISFMRVPRFMMLDGIDDGGMEKDRSHRLQEIIVNECESFEVDYQLIFATSEINPKIESSELVVGRYFNPEHRSLDIR